MATKQEGYNRYYKPERIGALTDGVIAIAITLLILDLKVPVLPPGYPEQMFVEDLAEQVPNFVAYLISFMFLARFWHIHHAIFASLKRCNTTTVVLNFAFLAFCSLVPFGSSLIGTYEFDPVAAVLFSVILGVAGLSLGLLGWHVAASPELSADSEATVRPWHWKYHSYGVPGAAVSASILVFISVWLALLVWILEPVAAFVLHRRSP